MSDNTNATFIFECILRNSKFMDAVDQFIETIIKNTNTFSPENVPQLVLLIMTMLSESYVVKNETDLAQLFEIFYNYIMTKINKYKDDHNYDFWFYEEKFKQSFQICIKLAVLKLNFSFRKNKSNSWCCFY